MTNAPMLKDARRLRTAVIGAGITGRNHASVLADYHRCELLAVCSRQAAAAAALAQKYAAPQAFTDYHELLQLPELDAVIIATPDFAHHELAMAAARAGKHVLIEKPLTTDRAQADQIVAEVRRAGVTGMTLFSHRWVPAYYQAKQRLASGELGRPLTAYARKNDVISVPTEMINWAAQTTCAWFLSSHDIDLLTWYMEDEPVEVHASGTRQVLVKRGLDTYDAIQALVQFKSGASAVFESGWVYPNTFPTMVDSWIALTCEQGVIQLDRQQEQLQVASPQRFDYPRSLLLLEMTGHPQGAVRQAITHWVDCALDGQPPLIPLEHSRQVTAILDAIHRSLASGQSVSVN
jgi:predicted dehydrogenase